MKEIDEQTAILLDCLRHLDQCLDFSRTVPVTETITYDDTTEINELFARICSILDMYDKGEPVPTFKDGQEDGMTYMLAQILANHGLDMREATPEALEIARQYGVEHLMVGEEE